jgi:FlaA1/EpsC-like NDP-sugar epimerase
MDINMTVIQLEKELERLYNNRIRQKYLNLTKDDIDHSGIVVFGAGFQTMMSMDTLLSSGIKPDWIIDRNPALTGKNISGIPIRPLSSFYELKDKFVLLLSRYIPSMI